MTVNLAGHANRIAALEVRARRQQEKIRILGGITKADRDRPPFVCCEIKEGGVKTWRIYKPALHPEANVWSPVRAGPGFGAVVPALMGPSSGVVAQWSGGGLITTACV